MSKKWIIDIDDKFYVEANDWMWDDCTFLGKYTSKNGKRYDLGILLKNSKKLIVNEYSLAIVYGNEPGNYISGYVYNENNISSFKKETLKRARLLNLIE